MQHDVVIMSYSHEISILLSFPSCFYWHKKYKNRTSNARVMIVNKAVCFFMAHGVEQKSFSSDKQDRTLVASVTFQEADDFEVSKKRTIHKQANG